MEGYIEEVLRVGALDNDDMKAFAWSQLQKAERTPKKLDPRTQLWNI